MENILPWLMLKSVPGVGNVLIKRLIDHFQTPSRVFGSTVQELVRIDGISDRLALSILRQQITDSVRKEADLIDRARCRLITLIDPDYPPLLNEIPDPPPYLYLYGECRPADPCIAVVGSRNATQYGINTAMQLARDFSKAGYTIVSGLARGIDTAAHEGSLFEGGRTLAILGSGLRRIYPSENLRLAEKISRSGAVISEFPLEAKPERHYFPARNRIISGCCLGVVIVEAAQKSGALITARLALEQNREVFAVPGNIRSSKSGGTHALIKQGAKLVECVEDVIGELQPIWKQPVLWNQEPPRPATPVNNFTPEEKQVLELLGSYPIHIDSLARTLNVPVGNLSGTLLKLELSGMVRQVSGNFSLTIKGSV